jgi:RNA polymerase sigma-70 factor (ECF subfamily)
VDQPHPLPHTDERDDRALMAAHLDGDAEAFGELVRRHRDRLWAVALRTTSDPDDAADAVQDALVSAFRNASSYRGDAAVTTWLHRIVVNACLDRARRRKVRPTTPLPDDLTDRPDTADPRDRQDEALVSLDVQAALATLPPDQRAALVLVDVLGHSVDDAAAILECPPGTVKSRCFRGRARLLPQLAHLRNPDAVPDVVSADEGPPAPTSTGDSTAADSTPADLPPSEPGGDPIR